MATHKISNKPYCKIKIGRYVLYNKYVVKRHCNKGLNMVKPFLKQQYQPSNSYLRYNHKRKITNNV